MATAAAAEASEGAGAAGEASMGLSPAPSCRELLLPLLLLVLAVVDLMVVLLLLQVLEKLTWPLHCGLLLLLLLQDACNGCKGQYDERKFCSGYWRSHSVPKACISTPIFPWGSRCTMNVNAVQETGTQRETAMHCMNCPAVLLLLILIRSWVV